MSATTPAYTQNYFIPLLEALERNAAKPYVYSRCAAVYISGLEIATEIEGAQPKQTDDLFSEAIGFWLAVAHLESGNDPSSLPTIDSSVTELVSSLEERYKGMMNENYLNQGIAVSGMVAEDLEVCRALKEAIVDKNR